MKQWKLLLLTAILVAGCMPSGSSADVDESTFTEEPRTEPTKPSVEETTVPTTSFPQVQTLEPPEILEENEPMPSEAQSEVEMPAGAESLVAQAKEKVIEISKAAMTADQISLMSVDEMQWRDSSLGCPQEGMMYLQVITPGYLIRLEVEGKVYEFHTNRTDRLVLCTIDGQDPLE